MKSIEHRSTKAGMLGFVAMCLLLAASSSSRAGPIAIATSGITEFGPTQSQYNGSIGGSAVYAQLIDHKGALIKDPAAGGSPFDYTTNLRAGGGMPVVPAMTQNESTQVGQRLASVFPDPVMGRDPKDYAATLRYRTAVSQDKVKTPVPSIAADAVEPGIKFASADATQKIITDSKGFLAYVGKARAQVQEIVPNRAGPGFAIAAVTDPIYMQLPTGGSSDAFNFTIGKDFTLKADKPGSFAAAYFHLATDQVGTLADFSIGITNDTTQLSDANISVDANTFHAGPDFFSSIRAFDNFLLGALTFDNGTKTVTVAPDASGMTADINLYTAYLSTNNPALALTFDQGTLAGNPTREPASLMLACLGVLALFGVKRLRRSSSS
jgi:hypothetical protein